MTNQEKCLRAFLRGEYLSRVPGVYGRIVKSVSDHVDSLTDNAERRVVMVMGPQGLCSILGLNGYDSLVKVGYTPEYIQYQVNRGARFWIVLFDRPKEMRIATWRASTEMLCAAYPEVSQLLKRALPTLKETSFAQFERLAGYRFLDVHTAGSEDPRYMTIERLRRSEGSALCVRRFLYDTVSFTDLYAGDGYTRTHDAKLGVREYVTPNAKLHELNNCLLAEIDVTLPQTSGTRSRLK